MANSNGAFRNEVLRRVRSGEMSPHTAEEWAKENGEIFTQKPGPTDFDPMTESDWTLPMVAAWIIDRSSEAVRNEWDKFRNERIRWRSCEIISPSGQREIGFELRRDEPRTLFEVFALDGELMYGEMGSAEELAYALRSKLLPAKGSAGGARDCIPSVSWKGPFTLDEPASRRDAIYAVAKISDDLGDEMEVYSHIWVSRESVLGIWIPVTPLSPGGASGDPERAPPPRLAATLPPGFDPPDWTLEQVLAWVAVRDMSQLRSLELADRARPKFFGRLWRAGLVDQRSENLLREALINEKLIGLEGLHPIWPGGRWRKKSLWYKGDIWFRPEEVMSLWPGTNAITAGPSEILTNPKAPGTAQDFPGLVAKRPRGRPTHIADNTVKRMKDDVNSGLITKDDLVRSKILALAEKYKVSRVTITKAIPRAIAELNAERDLAVSRTAYPRT